MHEIKNRFLHASLPLNGILPVLMKYVKKAWFYVLLAQESRRRIKSPCLFHQLAIMFSFTPLQPSLNSAYVPISVFLILPASINQVNQTQQMCLTINKIE